MLRDFSRVISEHLANYSVLSVMFVTAVASALYATLFIFPQISNKTNEKILDLYIFGYTGDEAYRLLTAIGKDGRAAYGRLYTEGYDWVFAASYCSLCASVLSMLLPQHTGYISVVNIFPILGAVCEFIENFFIVILLFAFPDRQGVESWAAWSSVLCVIKWFFYFATSISFVVAILYRMTVYSPSTTKKHV